MEGWANGNTYTTIRENNVDIMAVDDAGTNWLIQFQISLGKFRVDQVLKAQQSGSISKCMPRLNKNF